MTDTPEKVEQLMLEHLTNLKEAAEECDESQLGIITNAMVQTANFLTRPIAKPETDENEI